jgi:hypothetical protein
MYCTMPKKCRPGQRRRVRVHRGESARSPRRRSRTRGSGRRSRCGCRPAPCTAGMFSSITSTADRHRPGAALQRAPVGRGRVAHPQCHGAMTGLSSSVPPCPAPPPWALTMTLMPPWRYSSTSRERCRAIGRKAQRLQHLAQGLGPGGGVFDEFDAFHAQRVGRLVDRFAVVCFRHGESFWAGPNAAASAAGTSGPGERTPRTVGCGRFKTNQLFTFRSIIDRFQGYPPRPAPTLRPPCRP